MERRPISSAVVFTIVIVLHTSLSFAGDVKIRLPERISASELKRLLMDLPGTFELVDIRPREHFLDYHLPGAINVDIEELVQNPKYRLGKETLIIVDRDGSIAMAVGGVLSQKTKRSIKVLYKGLEAYWTETEGQRGGHIPPKVLPGTQRPSVPGAPPSLLPRSPVKPKGKSAGC